MFDGKPDRLLFDRHKYRRFDTLNKNRQKQRTFQLWRHFLVDLQLNISLGTVDRPRALKSWYSLVLICLASLSLRLVVLVLNFVRCFDFLLELDFFPLVVDPVIELFERFNVFSCEFVLLLRTEVFGRLGDFLLDWEDNRLLLVRLVLSEDTLSRRWLPDMLITVWMVEKESETQKRLVLTKNSLISFFCSFLLFTLSLCVFRNSDKKIYL